MDRKACSIIYMVLFSQMIKFIISLYTCIETASYWWDLIWNIWDLFLSVHVGTGRVRSLLPLCVMKSLHYFTSNLYCHLQWTKTVDLNRYICCLFLLWLLTLIINIFEVSFCTTTAIQGDNSSSFKLRQAQF